MTNTCDFCGAEMLDAGPPIGTYCSAGNKCKGWKTGYSGLLAKPKAPDVKDLIYKHHGLILTDEETGKNCCDFGTVERVVEAITADLRNQLSQRDRVIAERDAQLAAVGQALRNSDGCIAGIMQAYKGKLPNSIMVDLTFALEKNKEVLQAARTPTQTAIDPLKQNGIKCFDRDPGHDCWGWDGCKWYYSTPEEALEAKLKLQPTQTAEGE